MCYTNEAVQFDDNGVTEDLALLGCRFTLEMGNKPLVLCKEVGGRVTWKTKGQDKPTKQNPSVNYIVKCTLCSKNYWRNSLLQHLEESEAHPRESASYKNMAQLGARNEASEALVKQQQLGRKRKSRG